MNNNESCHKTSINWFPGHMQKTKRLIKEKYDLIDIVYEIVDARIPNSSKIKDLDELYISLGGGKFTISSVMKLICPKENPIEKKLNKVSDNKKQIIKNDILVEGMNEIKVSLSGCCKPIPGDNIIGYITKGSGITVHRSSCKNIIDLDERLINVRWNNNIVKKGR